MGLKANLARIPGVVPAYQWLRVLVGLRALSARLDTLDSDFRTRLTADIPVEPSLVIEFAAPATGSTGRGPGSDAAYVEFEDEFYDTRIVSEKQKVYVPYVRESLAAAPGPVVDLGCGRGEFLGILRSAGIEAGGAEINQLEVDALIEDGYAVVLADACEYLERCDDDSVAALVILQVVEHVAPDYLTRLLELAGRKLRRVGAVLVIETPNPRCVQVHGSYFNDLTHVRLYPAETLRFFLSREGFSDFDLVYTSPCSVEYRIPGAPECNYLDYGLVARR